MWWMCPPNPSIYERRYFVIVDINGAGACTGMGLGCGAHCAIEVYLSEHYGKGKNIHSI
jgi:hypothetical protein